MGTAVGVLQPHLTRNVFPGSLSSLPIESNHDQLRCRPEMSVGICCSWALRKGRFTNPAGLRGYENYQQLRITNRPILGQ